MEECPLCGGNITIIDFGSYKGKIWYHYQCEECYYQESEEPDWDSMSGGHDDY